MTRVYRQDGNCFFPTSNEALSIRDTLPAGTYLVQQSPLAGYYLERIANFELPKKLYGEVNKQAERIVETFLKRPAGTGALLSGQKGAGKTMLTKRISQLVQERHGIPTLVVGEPFHGEDFNAFISGMTQPAVVLFDEFEKVYDREAQPHLLTLLDGLHNSKKLFLLTCNERMRINTYMQNRPGRLFYALEFAGLSKDFIQEYCEDCLENKANIRGVQTVAAFFGEFSFDMLQALVEEMNRYGETASQAMQMLNMRPQEEETSFDVTGYRKGQPILCNGQSHTTVNRSPLALNGLDVTFYSFDDDDEDAPEGGLKKNESYELSTENLKSLDIDNGKFVFGTSDPDVTIHFTRRRYRPAPMNYDAIPEAA
jgi:hypothetical protein